MAAGFSDERRRIAGALRSVAAVEGRTVEAVADDVQKTIAPAAGDEHAAKTTDPVQGFGESSPTFVDDRERHTATRKLRKRKKTNRGQGI
jgi:hypothetical protein